MALLLLVFESVQIRADRERCLSAAREPSIASFKWHDLRSRLVA